MNNIDKEFIEYVKEDNLKAVTKLLKNGVNVHMHNDFALRYGAASNRLEIVNKLLEYGANVHARDDAALRRAISCGNFLIVSALLENGANLYCRNKLILQNFKKNFNEELARVLLPYCNSDDYIYFPSEYIRTRIVPTKSANK